MKIFLGVILIFIIGFSLLVIIGLIINSKWVVQEYPKDWEEEEDREIEKKFKKHNRNQE